MAHAEEKRAQATHHQSQQAWMSNSYVPDDLRSLNHDELLQYAQMLSLSETRQDNANVPTNNDEHLLYNQEDEDLQLALVLSKSEI